MTIQALTDALNALAEEWRQRSADHLRCSKAYKCRSTESIQAAYVKSAVIHEQHADELERILASAINEARNAEAESQPPAASGSLRRSRQAVGQRTAQSEPDGSQQASGPEPQDQGSGSLDMPELRSDDRAA